MIKYHPPFYTCIVWVVNKIEYFHAIQGVNINKKRLNMSEDFPFNSFHIHNTSDYNMCYKVWTWCTALLFILFLGPYFPSLFLKSNMNFIRWQHCGAFNWSHWSRSILWTNIHVIFNVLKCWYFVLIGIC